MAAEGYARAVHRRKIERLLRGACCLSLLAHCSRPTPSPITRDPVASATASSSAAPPPSGPPIVVTTGATFGELIVQANATTSLAMRVEIEARVDGAFEPRAYEMFLLDACDTKLGTPAGLPPCRTVSAGQTLRPVPFTGYTCSSQCNLMCDKNAQISGTTIRYVVKSCDGKLRWESAPVKVK